VNGIVDASSLPPHAEQVDLALAELSAQIQWISSISPVNLEEEWQRFNKAKAGRSPTFQYRVKPSFKAQRQTLMSLPYGDIEHPVLRTLLVEKQHELTRLLELIELRETSGFLQQSIALFGEAEPPLVASAKQIMAFAGQPEVVSACIGATEFVAAAERELDYYRSLCADFDARIYLSEHIAAGVMVADGQLIVASSLRIPRSRMESLLHHEIGTHILTHFNGGRQALRQLRSGLAHYDATQEGLGVLAEYLSGYLPLGRLRTLAARVIAVRALIEGADFLTVYRCLTMEHGISDYGAFVTTARVFRGGGLTKDAVYLRGLYQILDYLKEGHSPEDLFVGKFNLDQFAALDELRKHGWLVPSCLLPRYWQEASAHERIQRCAERGLAQLLQEAVT
jgi:uncharacterized protein (TIGR02421 family)